MACFTSQGCTCWLSCPSGLHAVACFTSQGYTCWLSCLSGLHAVACSTRVGYLVLQGCTRWLVLPLRAARVGLSCPSGLHVVACFTSQGYTCWLSCPSGLHLRSCAVIVRHVFVFVGRSFSLFSSQLFCSDKTWALSHASTIKMSWLN